MPVITNLTDIPLPIAVWAVDDDYDYNHNPSYISVTSLLKPIRQIILSRRAGEQGLISNDVEDFISSAMGSGIHAGVERAWKERYKENLKKLGVTDTVINKIRINPTQVNEGEIPIYIEQRGTKDYKGYTIGGKFDMVLDGLLHDNKTTTAYKWLTGSSDKDYQMQGSLYKWLNPDKITESMIRINFIFTDWQKVMALKDKNYPQHRAMKKDIPLLSSSEVEAFLDSKIKLLEKYKNAPEDEIPECTDEELWRGPTKYKYFANPTAERATKNFEDYNSAFKYMMNEKSGKGVIRVVPGEARRCNYCSACALCSQYKRLHGSD